MGLYVPSECHQDWKTKFKCVMSGRFLKARFKCPLAHFEHNMRAACFDMMNKISLLTMCCWGTNRSRYASNVHLALSFHLHVCLLVQPNYANKGEEDSLLQIMTLKGVYCSRQTLLALRRQGLARVTSNINCWLSLWKEHLPRSHWQHGKIWFWCWCWCCPAELARILFLFWSPLHSSLVSSCALVHYQLSWSSFATQYTPVNCRHMPLRDKESKFWKWTIWLRRQR